MSLFFDHKNTIVSYGVICYHQSEKIRYLLIQQKFSFAFISIIRGLYDNIEDIIKLVKNLREEEVKLFKTKTFRELWQFTTYNPEYYAKYKLAEVKFSNICKGNKTGRCSFNISFMNVLNHTKRNTSDLEWGFPKGKKEKGETIKECAIREFGEETNLDPKLLRMHEDLYFKEEFTGTNGKKYVYNYFVMEYNNKGVLPPVGNHLNEFQRVEISDIKWDDYEEATLKFNIKKREEILEEVDKIINIRRIYTEKKPVFDKIIKKKTFGVVLDYEKGHEFIICPVCNLKIKVRLYEEEGEN
jgi:8-oxo-dGTP pyrophosphatase MutT (NUDIX family)